MDELQINMAIIIYASKIQPPASPPARPPVNSRCKIANNIYIYYIKIKYGIYNVL
jgi:hypothetical protein